MNPLHLIWIVPLCGSIGYIVACLMYTASEKNQSKGNTN